MSKEKILVVEDEADIRELMRYNLEREGYQVSECESAEDARVALETQSPDLILLDLMLPGTDGFAFCRKLRAWDKTARIPVIMVTARNEDADIVAGLEVGADDYITKPFSARIMLARVKAVIRRCADEPVDGKNLIVLGPVQIDREHHAVKIDGKDVVLTLSEFKMLDLFVRRPGVVFSRYQIVDAVHGEDYPVTDRSVDVQIVGLRRKLGDHSAMIETVRGVGYKLNLE
ncbi:MAG: response regulator transcription factor [Kiritimatiellae bacterium]|jgi:two-component system alkaline phosphatase synthesis response regulator PhoP|nr:response regulator transcription factor [Kiritimatiellia bacterium]